MKPLTLSDPDHIGPHRLLARIGAGGMGHVYLARSPGGRLAAVKVVHKELARNADFRARFDREIRVAQRVRGPFTPAVTDAGPEDAAPWMATEYVPGPTLKEAVLDGGPLPEESLSVLALGLARALQAIHGAGLMHRDLKPGNVLLSPRGPQVIDFGIARAVEGTVLTRTGQSFGTPAYAAPEAVLGEEQTAASDVFALAGVVVYAAVGRPPFGKGTAVQVLRRVVGEEPDLGGFPNGDLRDLVARCMAKEPGDRPGSEEIVHALSAGPLPAAEHGWLPEQVSKEISDRERELQGVMRTVPVAPPAAPPVPKPNRTPLVVCAAAAAAVLVAGTGLALVRTWEGEGAVDGATGGPDGSSAAGDSSQETDSEISGRPGYPDLPGVVRDIRFSPDGDTMHVVTSQNHTEWDWREGELLDSTDEPPTSLDINARGMWAVGAIVNVGIWRDGEGDELTLTYDPEDLDDVRSHESVSLADSVTRLAFLQRGFETNTVMVWDWSRSLDGDEIIMEVESAVFAGGSTRVEISPDGAHVAVTNIFEDVGTVVLEVDSGETVAEFPQGGLQGEVQFTDTFVSAFAPDRPVIAVHQPDQGTLVLYDLDEGETVLELDAPGEVNSLTFTPDGSELLSGGGPNGVGEDYGGRRWDVVAGEELTSGDTLLLDEVTVHPDGETVVVVERGDRGSSLLFLDPQTLLDTHTIG
ncbi:MULTISPECIES: WD40 repeat domain-containing serine/threonine protein kinase [unclassified Nocardiopsis]|uniref:WD40 repeat domain-containing serine/threonine protein kinase n=1 Tax=unclassified Nocardiopsis TaxID=2649073 RepID=UPI0033C8AC55